MTAPIVGLIPARSGSKRIHAKNVRPLRGHPLIAYTVAAALESGVFDAVVVSTDSAEVAEISEHYGAEVPGLRPAEMAGDLSPDIEWVRFTLTELAAEGRHYAAFSILRPTSPLRQAETIRRAWSEFSGDESADSLRAVELCSQHPGKMWRLQGDRLTPLLDDKGADPPWHSTPYQSLPPVYVQNASLEMARTHVVRDLGTIAGREIRPFLCRGYEGFDLNQPADWAALETLLAAGEVRLPAVPVTAYRGAAVGAEQGGGAR